MGTTGAMGMAEQVAEGNIDIDVALYWHLSSNHYPSIPSFFVPACKAAIEAAREEEWERNIELPEEVSWKDGRKQIHAWELIESFHLDSFL